MLNILIGLISILSVLIILYGLSFMYSWFNPGITVLLDYILERLEMGGRMLMVIITIFGIIVALHIVVKLMFEFLDKVFI